MLDELLFCASDARDCLRDIAEVVDRPRSDAIPSQPTRQPLVPGLTGRHSGGTSQLVSHRQPAAASIKDPLRLMLPRIVIGPEALLMWVA